jgi:hypothetical protein
MYEYLCQAGQEKSPTYKIELQQLQKQEPQKQPQQQAEQKTEPVPDDMLYRPTLLTPRKPIRELNHTPLSALTPDMTFGEAIDILRHSVRPPLNIVVFWRDLEDNADVDKDTPVGIEGLPGITLKKHLQLILASVSTMGDGELSYVIEDGIIKIATKDSLPKVMSTRVYDITDLTASPARYFDYGGSYMFPQGRYGPGSDFGRGRGQGYDRDYGYGRYPSTYGQDYRYGTGSDRYRGYTYTPGISSGTSLSFR